MKLLLRKAVPDDYERMAELAKELGYKPSNPNMRNKLVATLNNGDNFVFVAVDSEKVIGWIHGFYAIRIQSDSFIEIGGLVVSTEYRKMGIGKMLVESVIKWTESRNCKTIRVRCNTLRTESHKFYETINFEQTKEQKVFEKKMI